MIEPDAEVIGRKAPYRRIAPFHPGRKAVITRWEWVNSGATREPDPAIYQRDHLRECWILKDGA